MAQAVARGADLPPHVFIELCDTEREASQLFAKYATSVASVRANSIHSGDRPMGISHLMG